MLNTELVIYFSYAVHNKRDVIYVFPARYNT